MASVLDEELVRRAIELALPSVREIVKQNTWGPQGVVIVVRSPALKYDVVHVMEELGPEGDWERLWEGDNFRKIAFQKLYTSEHGTGTSRDVIKNRPWLLQEGDSLWAGSATEDGGLIVAVSGAYVETDETVAWIVWNIIWLLCQRRINDLDKQNIHCL